MTKGDANSTEDPGTISFDRYRGTMVFAIPLAGYLAAALQRYRMTAIGILALFWTVSVIRHLAGKRKQVMTGENM